VSTTPRRVAWHGSRDDPGSRDGPGSRDDDKLVGFRAQLVGLGTTKRDGAAGRGDGAADLVVRGQGDFAQQIPRLAIAEDVDRVAVRLLRATGTVQRRTPRAVEMMPARAALEIPKAQRTLLRAVLNERHLHSARQKNSLRKSLSDLACLPWWATYGVIACIVTIRNRNFVNSLEKLDDWGQLLILI